MGNENEGEGVISGNNIYFHDVHRCRSKVVAITTGVHTHTHLHPMKAQISNLGLFLFPFYIVLFLIT
jgi:hypothetical protein